MCVCMCVPVYTYEQESVYDKWGRSVVRVRGERMRIWECVICVSDGTACNCALVPIISFIDHLVA